MKKKLSLVLSIVLLCAPFVYAQTAQDNVFEIKDFSKLLHSQVSPYAVDSSDSVEARNLRSNTIYGSLNKRDPMLLYGSAGSFPITGMHRFYKSDNTQYLLVSGSTLLKVGNDDTGLFTTIRDQMTDGARWQFVTYNDLAIGTNGTDMVQKYDGKLTTTDNTAGARTVNILTADLGAPFAELNTGANLTASSWYQYRVGFYDGTNYYFSTARSNAILTGAAVRDVTLTDIPLGPSGTTARYIYRTVGQASRSAVLADTTFYKIATISDNNTITYNDTMVDTTADDDAAPAWATVAAGIDLTPPVAKYLTIHKERLWLANNPTYNSDVYFSYPFDPQIFYTARDYEPIRPDDGDQITFIRTFLGNLTIGKNNTIQKFLTDDASSTKWVVTDPFTTVGCQAHYSAQVTPYGLIYLGHDGLYNFTGESTKLISDSISKDMLDISKDNYANVTGVYLNNIYQLAYTSAESGAGSNNRVAIFDFIRDAYEIDDKNINAFAIFDSGTDYGTIYSGSSLSDGKIMAHASAPSTYVVRYKSQFDAGTNSSIVVAGSEDSPSVSIGWGITVGSITMAGVTMGDLTYAGATVDRPGTVGIWYSPAIQLNASSLNKLSWNENLGDSGNVTFALRTAITSGGLTGAWSSEYSDPSGSDVSAVTGRAWAQLRATLTTADILKTPYLYTNDNSVVRLTYSKEGTAGETTIPTVWKTGYVNFNTAVYKKRIREVLVFYAGTAGTLHFGLKNNEGTISTGFDIDLSRDPAIDNTDEYTGTSQSKIFQWLPPMNSDENPTTVGESFQFSIAESGIVPWSVYKILVRYDNEENYF